MRNLNVDPRENAPVKHAPTPDDLRTIDRRRVERIELEQAVDALNLARGLALGRALRGLSDKV